MVLAGKLQAETLVRAPAEKFHEIYMHRPHHISKASPEKIQKCHLHEGDWGSPGSIIEWNYVIRKPILDIFKVFFHIFYVNLLTK